MNPIYQFTIPVFVKMLTALDGLLLKTANALPTHTISEADLLEARLAADMFSLKKQVQIACDNAKGAAARLSGTEVPVHADDEQTIAELRTRIEKTVAYLATISEASFEGAMDRQVTLPYFPQKYLTGFDYAREQALPNFFFHLTTAYAILRKEGLMIGKADYIGGLPLKELN